MYYEQNKFKNVYSITVYKWQLKLNGDCYLIFCTYIFHRFQFCLFKNFTVTGG